MADEPENLVLAMLREMRSETREMRTELAAVREKQDEHTRLIGEAIEGVYLAVGIATVASNKIDKLAARFDGFERRLRSVEGRGAPP